MVVQEFYLFFKASGLPARFIEDLKLQLHGDLRRFNDARALALRLVHRSPEQSEGFYEEPGKTDEQSWSQDSWGDASWVEHEEWFPEEHEGYWQDSDDWWYYDESEYDPFYEE